MYQKLLNAFRLVSHDDEANQEMGKELLMGLVGNELPTFEDAARQMLEYKWSDLYHGDKKTNWKERQSFIEYVNARTTDKGHDGYSFDYGRYSRSIGEFCGVEISFNTYTFRYVHVDWESMPPPRFWHSDASKICPIVDKMDKAMRECEKELRRILDEALAVIDQGDEAEVGKFMYHMGKARDVDRLRLEVPHDYEIIPRLNKRFTCPVELKVGDFVSKDGTLYVVTGIPYIQRYDNDWTLSWFVPVAEPRKDKKPTERGHSSSLRIETVEAVNISDWEWVPYYKRWGKKEID